MNAATPEQTGQKTYRGWNVHYDNPPIPMRSMDWSATSPDYDVDCDEDGFHVCAGRQVHAATYEALRLEIDAAIEEGQDAILEEVARLIAPGAWSVFDAEKARMLKKYKGEHVGWPADQYRHKESMNKARAILVLLGFDIAPMLDGGAA